MTRGTTVLALGVCIGIILLFGDAVAEVTEASTTVSRNDSDFQKASTPGRVLTTTLTKVTSTRQHQKEKDGVGSDAESQIVDERSNTSSQTAEKSSEDTDGSSSGGSSDGSRKPRYGEISAESSGKSSSTKTVPEESPLRLSRTNELLTVAAAKPTSNDSRQQQDGKKIPANATLHPESVGHEESSNVVTTVPLPSRREKPADEKLTADTTAKNPDLKRADPATGRAPVDRKERGNTTANTEEEKKKTVMTVGSIRVSVATSSPLPMSGNDAVKLDEKRGKIVKLDYGVASKMESNREKNATSHDFKDRGEVLAAEDHGPEERESIAEHDATPAARKNAIERVGTTASEALDLERIDEKGHEGVVSLINDTYVNYKTETKDGARNHSTTGASDGPSRGVGDPKGEVEVVANVTHRPTLKIVAVANDTATNDRIIYTKRKEQMVADKREDEFSQERKIAAAFNATMERAEEHGSIGKAENQVKLAETTTVASVRHDERQIASSTRVTIPSPAVPQGRTIELSDVNEFASVEAKFTVSTTATVTTAAKVDGVEVATKRANSSVVETRPRPPYPYLKSGKEATSQATTEAVVSKLLGNGSGVTMETSAYENTIGREEGSEKKFVVTEASVVIENSIQQRKSDERSANESTNSSTESSSSSVSLASVVTVMPVDVAPTNVTPPDVFNGSAKRAEAATDAGDASGAKQQNEEGYDVTGNGITEVSMTAAETNGRGNGEPAGSSRSGITESLTLSRTMETPRAASLNADIQTDPEEAMMIRSTLVVTESTIMPSDKGATGANDTTSPTEIDAVAATTIRANSTQPTTRTNVTAWPFARSSNATTEATPFTTLNPDESSIPTTTSVEFEFVGLTEAVSPPSRSNATERIVSERTTFARITIPPSSTTKGNLTEETTTTTRSEESTELPTTTEDGTPTTNQVSTASNETSEVRGPPITQPTVVEERRNLSSGSTRNEMTTSAVDLTSLTVTDATATTSVIDSPSESKNSTSNTPNVTEIVTAPRTTTVSSSSSETANVTRDHTSSTLEPRIFWSTTGFTDAPDKETTDGVQTLSPDEITLLVKIVIEGTPHEICPRMQNLREALADVVNNGVDRHVLPNQIVIHQNPCPESTSSSPTPVDVTLTTILVYVVDEDGKFDAATTKILPSLYKMSHNFPVRIHKFLLVQETDSGNAIAVVVVSSVAFICLVLLAGLLFIMRKRQTRFNYGERCRPVSLDAYSLDSVSAYNSVRRKGAARSSKRSYGNPTFEDSSAIPSHPLNFAGLSTFCNDVNAINEEFANIPQVSAKIDELPSGAEVKNRYANVIPLPETRVPLQRLNNDALTEYINASYVRGPKNATKYYIACQAPIESTVTDFWRMIWEQQCKVIIMLTDLVENGVEKCTEYIPPSEVTDCHRLYGDYQVTLKKRETKEKYAISTLHLKNLENNTFREVFHIWYLWPVSGIQSDGAGLIAVLLEARALQRGGPGPIVVHCSPGTGRTGTLIALDLGIRQYEITRTVDVPRVVYTIRRDRAGAVQTKEQYAFIYKALNLYATKLAGGVLEST